MSRNVRARHVIALATLALLLAPALPLATAAGDGPAVTIAAAAFQFAPGVVAIPVGTTVTWEAILFPHTVTTAASLPDAVQGRANDARNEDASADSFRAGLAQGQTFTHTFDAAGTYYYFCEPHARLGMWGVVDVIG